MIWSRFAFFKFFCSVGISIVAKPASPRYPAIAITFIVLVKRMKFPKALFSEQMVSLYNQCIRSHSFIQKSFFGG